MYVQQDLGRECCPEVGVPRFDQLERVLPKAFIPAGVRRPASGLVDQSAAPFTLVRSQQPVAFRSLTPSTAAAAATVRRQVRTSLNTSIRLRSHSLIETHPILRT